MGEELLLKLVAMATESSQWLIMGKTVSPRCNTFSFDPISNKLAGNEDRLKISDEFEFT